MAATTLESTSAPPRATALPAPAPSLRNSTVSRLLRFALATIRRRPERFALSTFGIALAILAVTVVRTISTSFAMAGDDSVTRVLDGAPLWVVPAAGVHYDSEVGALLADGPPAVLAVPDGWTATRTLTYVWRSPAGPLALHGSDVVPAGTAELGREAADRLGVAAGDRLRVGGAQLDVRIDGDDGMVSVATATATALGATAGWWTVRAPAADAGRTDLGQLLGSATGLPSTTNPAVQPQAGGRGLVYDAVGGSGPVTFAQKFSAMFAGQVTSSALGLISTIGLVLGFVIAVSSFLASVQERRREFGIMSSIGLSDEVLYFFLVESAIVFAVAWLVGISLAGVAVWLVVPQLATAMAWLQAAGTVAAYLPAMAVIGALVPVHRLLQQRPIQLLGDAA
jgi:putative ABC transport system permease protein